MTAPSTLASGFAEQRASLARLPRVFDVCHAGVVLRAVLCVHAVVALVLGWRADTWQVWLADGSLAVVVVLPAVLLWLLLACLMQRALARLPRWAYWAAALALGAACALLAQAGWQALLQPLQLAPASGRLAWLMAALAGVAFAAAMVHWLEQRLQLQQPVATAARLAELQARIRPHFLFNALNSAIALVQVDPARAEAVLEDLAELFRAALAEGRDVVRLGDEIELAQRYLAIEQVRFGARLRLHWSLDAAAAAARVPPLVLQPLVENAVRHGVEPAAEGGEISVTTRVERGTVVLRIVNSLPASDQALARPGHGLALRNVRDRLYLLHDVDLRFEAGPAGPSQWCVTLRLPLPR
ncbi:MAG: histidine kinase [Burkholderiales bacterium]